MLCSVYDTEATFHDLNDAPVAADDIARAVDAIGRGRFPPVNWPVWNCPPCAFATAIRRPSGIPRHSLMLTLETSVHRLSERCPQN